MQLVKGQRCPLLAAFCQLSFCFSHVSLLSFSFLFFCFALVWFLFVSFQYYLPFSSSDVVLTTPRPPSSSDRSRRICTYCQKLGHDITECYRKKKDDKRKQYQSRGILPLPQAAAVSSVPVDDPVVTDVAQ